MPKDIILTRDDFNNSLHPRMWEDLCDDLGLDPVFHDSPYPDEISVLVQSAKIV